MPTPDAPELPGTLDAEAFVGRPRETLRGALGEDEPDTLGAPGEVLLMGTLGVGGMAVVRLGRQSSLDREVAVKTLRADKTSEASRKRLLREAWITGLLEHPNVVPIHDLRLDAQGAPQILLKRIDGEPWSSLLAEPERLARRVGAQDPLSWNVRVLIALCNAVDFAHSRGILHRDIKPDNVMIGAFGEVTLLDWGIAARLVPDPQGGPPAMPPDGKAAGTPAYMAPEMLYGHAQTARTDVYLLGAVLHELLTGHPPHQGSSLSALVESIVTPTPPPPDTPPTLARLCVQALSIDPGRRPESAAAFRARLERFLDRRSGEQLVEAARVQLDAFRDALRDGAPELETAERFSSARFGFAQALAAWPDDAAARAGLDACLQLAAEWALGRGDLQVARYHLQQVHTPDPALARRVEEAVLADAERTRALQELAYQSDARVGWRDRNGIGYVLLFTALGFSLWLALRPEPPSYLAFAATSVAILAVLGAGLLWWGRGLLATRYNRHLVASIAFIPLAQTVVDLGAWLRGWPPVQSHGVVLVVAACGWFFMALSIQWRILGLSVVWGMLWLIASMKPALTYVLQGVGVTVSIVWMARVWPKPEE
ncbi:MAG: protein kinase [Alphaproteobacteria bacterium]|nr:protein kinase [Alphaproteobacteria bacterium]